LSSDFLVKMTLERQAAFKNLPSHLKSIKQTARRLDEKAEVYLFGSAATGENNYSSDIDILVVTDVKPAEVIVAMWEAGIEEPFEIHVHTQREAEFFRRTAKLIRI
jgi:predicted nucleotidyltransferase